VVCRQIFLRWRLYGAGTPHIWSVPGINPKPAVFMMIGIRHVFSFFCLTAGRMVRSTRRPLAINRHAGRPMTKYINSKKLTGIMQGTSELQSFRASTSSMGVFSAARMRGTPGHGHICRFSPGVCGCRLDGPAGCPAAFFTSASLSFASHAA
jgi:hypothetical protein